MKKRLLFFFAVLSGSWLQAQEVIQNNKIRTHMQEGSWYASPWIWIIGAAFFILLLVALTREKKDN